MSAIYKEWKELLEEEAELKAKRNGLKERILEEAKDKRVAVDDAHYLYIQDRVTKSFSKGVRAFLKEKGIWDVYSKLDASKLGKDVDDIAGVESFMEMKTSQSVLVDKGFKKIGK